MVCGRRGSSGSDPPRLDGGMERGGEGRGGEWGGLDKRQTGPMLTDRKARSPAVLCARVGRKMKPDSLKRLEIKPNAELNGI